MKSKGILNLLNSIKTLLVASYRNPVKTGFWGQKEKLADSQKQRTGLGEAGKRPRRVTGQDSNSSRILHVPYFWCLYLPSPPIEDGPVPSPAETRGAMFSFQLPFWLILTYCAGIPQSYVHACAQVRGILWWKYPSKNTGLQGKEHQFPEAQEHSPRRMKGWKRECCSCPWELMTHWRPMYLALVYMGPQNVTDAIRNIFLGLSIMWLVEVMSRCTIRKRMEKILVFINENIGDYKILCEIYLLYIKVGDFYLLPMMPFHQ